jgi:prevent-host-death family protein
MDDAAEDEAAEPIEVTMGELDRRAAGVIRDVAGGRIAVISRHGKPVAVIVPLADAEALRPVGIEGDELTGMRERFANRERRRWWSRILHGRWYNGHGVNGPYEGSRRR